MPEGLAFSHCPRRPSKLTASPILPGSAESQHPLSPCPGDTEPLQTRVQPKNPHVLINNQVLLDKLTDDIDCRKEKLLQVPKMEQFTQPLCN